MDIYTFLSLTKEEQELVVSSADFIAERNDDAYTVQLFAAEDFYIEVFLSSTNEIVKYKAFKSRRLLIPFLDNLNLEPVPVYR